MGNVGLFRRFSGDRNAPKNIGKPYVGLPPLGTMLNQIPIIPDGTPTAAYDITDVGFKVVSSVDTAISTVVALEYGTVTGVYPNSVTAAESPVSATVDVNFTITGLTPYTDYYYRVKAGSAAGTAYSTEFVQKTAEPAIISDGNSVAWYDYSSGITKDGSNFVSAWNSRIGTNHLAQATGTNQPLCTATGVLFDGIDNFMQSPNVALTQPNFVYIVLNQKNWFATDCFISTVGLIRQDTVTPGIRIFAGSFLGPNNNLALNTYGILRALFNGALSKMIINATSPTTGNAGVGTSTYISIGRPPDGTIYANFEVKEIIIRKIADDSTNETAIYNYLKNKYSL